MNEPSLYERLGGYDAICQVADELLPRLMNDSQLGRFWENRGTDGLEREKQFLVDFLAHSSGGPMYYTGRDMLTTHRGMGIRETDWQLFIGHLEATLDELQVPEAEATAVVGFIQGTHDEIVE
jgi:hemoglobin